MDVSHLLLQEPPHTRGAASSGAMASTNPSQPTHVHQYPTRHAMASQAQGQQNAIDGVDSPSFRQTSVPSAASTPHDLSPPVTVAPKSIAFELLFPEAPDYRARLPMRVQIYPHDTTDSIITTVKNFYGLYEGPGGTKGVSFEDAQGHTLIARYENFHDGMIVYVRVVLEPTSAFTTTPYASASPPQYHPRLHGDGSLHSPYAQPAQVLTHGQSLSRPTSRTTAQRSISPHSGRGQRSVSVTTSQGQPKRTASRSMAKSRASSQYGGVPELNADALNGFSDSDGGPMSTAGSRKAKSDQLASAEISLDNIVEGGRRKRAKFESSELPLFVPPQVPVAASASSGSPAGHLTRRSLPPLFNQPSHRALSYPQASRSPYGLASGTVGSTRNVQPGPHPALPSVPQHGHHLRTRPPAPFPMPRYSMGAGPSGHGPGILPTPDPTIASCISDEDVAIQLMRLGDASNISNGTRHSGSTLDDGLSGVADVASSAGATSDDESDGTEQNTLPAEPRLQQESSPIPLPGSIKRRHKHLDEILPSFDSTEPSGDEEVRKRDAGPDLDGTQEETDNTEIASREDDHKVMGENFMNELEQVVPPKVRKSAPTSNGVSKSRGGNGATSSGKAARSRPASIKAKSKASPATSVPKTPMTPASLPPHSRKASTTSTINFQHNLREDEEDLSSKPRCQRCRKSKKGCDRQRPCQRCKDAGIGIEGCISEEETNGRKGRFGRHMGVAVKKGTTMPALQTGPTGSALNIMEGVAGSVAPEKANKKRKR
ncbi:MAG: hypothetical protein M1816_007153 [Peltula sp. TS41687]|nr:MAG: hypothetical protein M1816_007153 [Peltula sp. TS41687]